LSPGYKIPSQMEGNPFFTEAIKAKALAASAASKANFGSAYKAGVKIAFGTDSAVTKHGDNADEFAMMVDSGMTEMDAIRSATVVAAELLEMSDTLGTIEAGKMADIIAVDANPLDDMTVLEDVSVVIKDGKRAK
jgi:imidazolonepropionase-like amidohydrolase